MRGAARCSCGEDAPVHGLAAHPLLTRFACSGHSGLLQLWDYSEQRLLLMRMFDKLLGHCLAFSPNGKLLAAGFTNGTVKLLAGMTLEEIATFRVSRECITQVCGMGIRRPHHQPPPPPPPSLHPSPLHPHLGRLLARLLHLATADADRCTAIYRLAAVTDESTASGAKREWEYVGK